MKPLAFPKYINKANIKNAIYHFKNFGFRSMLRKTKDYLEFTKKYNRWVHLHKPSEQTLQEQQQIFFSYHPLISIIVPVYNTPKIFLSQMIDSIIAQTYPHWELCIADGSPSSSSYITEIIHSYQKDYPSIKYKKLSKNLGISGNTNAALSFASGDYIGLLDHDDLLTPDCLYEYVTIMNRYDNADILYCDEDKVNTSLTSYFDPYFKPDFNLELLRSCNYITHFFMVRRSIAEAVGGFSKEYEGSQDFDFILKCCEKALGIYHIPKILYHWRIHPASVAGDPKSKSYAYESGIKALQGHLCRCNEKASVSKAKQWGYYQISYSLTYTPVVSILLKECDKNIESELRHSSYYSNIELISSAHEATGEYLIILYQLKHISSNGWIEYFLSNMLRPSIGIISGTILFKTKRIQEAGLIFTSDGQIHSPFKGIFPSDPGYCFHAMVQRNCSLVGPHCLMTKTSLYRDFLATDMDPSSSYTEKIYTYCHEVINKGYHIITTPFVSAISTCRSTKYPVCPYYKNQHDPYYNPNFSENKPYRLN